VFDSQTKFQSENVMADVYLGIAIAGANTLIVMAVAIAFVIIWKATSVGGLFRFGRIVVSPPSHAGATFL
jgi:hypothetical protein